MGGWLRLWEGLIGDPVDEAEALELVLAELRRGTALPGALRYAASAMGGLSEGRGGSRPALQLQRELDRMALGLTCSGAIDDCREPWRSILAAWAAFPSPDALADFFPCLLSKLRTRRALRVGLTEHATYALLGSALLAGGCLAMSAWQFWGMPSMGLTWLPGSFTLTRDWTRTLAIPMAALGLALVGEVAWLAWVRGRLIPKIVGGTGSELLFFVGAGVASGVPLIRVLQRATDALPGVDGPDRRLLLDLIRQVETGSRLSLPETGRASHRSLAQAVLLLQNGLLAPDSLQFAASTVVDRFRAQRRWMLDLALVAAVTWFLLVGMPAYLALLGGPTGAFWSNRILPALRQVTQEGARAP